MKPIAPKVCAAPDADFWHHRRVLLTGHTGFKGGWLALWLREFGAQVTGLALPPATEPNLFTLARVDEGIDSRLLDIRDRAALTGAVREANPEIVFHLAAQALVRPSYQDPLGTFATNVQGTANLLDALRGLDAVRVVVAVTTDKVYRNLEQPPLVNLGSAPPSNAYLSAERLHAPETWYPLRVLVCTHCWLVQTEDFARAEDLFSADYAYFSSVSSSWLAHAERYVTTMVERFDLSAKSQVIEVAANDGYLLQYVQARGIPCLGIEPTQGTAEAARAKGIPVVEAFFGQRLAEQLAAEGIICPVAASPSARPACWMSNPRRRF